MNNYLIFGIGLLAQVLFSARLLVQWIASERAKKVLSPTLFWKLSMVASFLLFLYGWLRNDFSIIAGQLVAYFIYIWNLKIKGSWDTFSWFSRGLFSGLPLLAVGCCFINSQDTFIRFFAQEDIPIALIVFGLLGQFTFTLRFVYQWWYSRRIGKSVLPVMFWIISLAGSSMIIIYAIIRHDPVLILGQATGFVVYARNLVIGKKDLSVGQLTES